MKRFRGPRIALLFILVLVIGGVVAARFYLSSASAARLVARHLHALTGGPVEVGSAHIGLVGGTTLRGVKLSTPDGQPFLVADEIDADLSALGVLRGHTSPTQLTLRGAQMELRVDRHGKVLTRFPKTHAGGAWPHVRIEDGQFTLDQEGKPPMVIHDITATVTPDPDRVRLEGSAADSYWGDWTVEADYQQATGAVSLTLHTPEVHATPEKLERVPYVPDHVWKEVQADGTTPVKVAVHFSPKSPVHHRVELEPHDTWVRVPAIDLEATRAHGQVVVDDNRVELRDVHGRTAGGEISTSADLDFRGARDKLHFDVSVKRVILTQLPPSWHLRERKLEGRLTGHADVTLVLDHGKVETRGSGEGLIEDAKVAGFPTAEPVKLRLHSEGNRLQFAARNSVFPSLVYAALMAPQGPPAESAGKSGGLSLRPNDLWRPTRLAGILAQGAGTAADKVADVTGRTITRLSQVGQPPPPGKEPTYLDINLSLKDVDLVQLVQRLNVKLPFTVKGRLNVKVQAGLPVDTPRDLKAYRLKGTVTLPRLELAGFVMADVDAKFAYDRGVLRLEELKGRVPGPGIPAGKVILPRPAGTFAGTARLQLVPEGELSADLEVERIPVDLALRLLPKAAGLGRGSLTGTVRGSAPAARLREPASWKGEASLRAPLLSAYGVTLRDARVGLTVDKGVATLSALKGKLEGGSLTGSGNVQLSKDYPFEGKAGLHGLDLAGVQRLAPAFRPPVAVKGSLRLDALLKGTLSLVAVNASGTAGATDLAVEGVRAKGLSFAWALDPKALKLNDIKAQLYDGAVTGSATVPLRESAAGAAKLAIKNLDAQALAKAVGGVPVRLEGRVSGTVAVTLPPVPAEGKSRVVTADVELTAPRLRVQGIPADRLKGSVTAKGGVISYRLQGETLGGTFDLNGKVPPRRRNPRDTSRRTEGARVRPVALLARPPAKRPPDGTFRLKNARLSLLVRALKLEQLGRLHGRVSIYLPFWYEGRPAQPVGLGEIEVRRLSWGDTLLADQILGDARLSARGVELRIRNARLAGSAAVEGRLVYGFGPRARRTFGLVVRGAEASRLLAFSPELANVVQGPLDVHLYGALGDEWRGGGSLHLTRGKVAGLEVSEWRVPIRFVFAPRRGNLDMQISDSGAQLGGGRADLSAHLVDSGEGLRVDGHLQLVQAELRSLVSAGVTSYVQGRVTGRVNFAGSNVRSVNDLTADVQAKLSQTQAVQLPVVSSLLPFLGGAQSNATFQSGDLRGRLAGGVFRVQRMTLAGTYLQLIILGNVTLQGRLDLDVTARTGLLGPTPLVLRAFGLAIPAAGPIPVGLLLQASALLSNQVLHFMVGGTIRHPVIRVQPVRMLTEDAVRFFFNRGGLPGS